MKETMGNLFITTIFILILVYVSETSILTQTKDFLDSEPIIKPVYFVKGPQKVTLPKEQPVEPPLFIGSFNIQTMGRKKFNNSDAMYVIKRVVLRYDLILILEIHTDVDDFMFKFLKDVNRALPKEQAYNMVLSERKKGTREHCAFLYRKNKLRLIKSESYYDPAIFYRKPFIAIFEAFTLRDMKKFAAVGHHVKPSHALTEINGLASVYDYIKMQYNLEDVLLMGDFNADCTYIRENDWDKIALWYRPEFTWAITNKMGTTTNYRKCALDRFVYAGENMNNGVILSSAGVFDFQEEFMLNVYQIRNISDHWPIELKIRGKMSKVAEKHLTADICFKIRDSRKPKNVTGSTVTLARKYFFNATKTDAGILLNKETRMEDDMLNALAKLKVGLPNLVSHELIEAIKYKVSHGTLNDDSSFADINQSRYKVKILCTEKLVEASICRTTSIN